MRRRIFWIGVAALAAIGVLGALTTIPNLEEEPLSIRADDVVPVRRTTRSDVVQFAVAPVFPPGGTARGFDPLSRHLSGFLARPVRLVQRSSYEEVNELLRTRGVQVALICAGAYLTARRRGTPLDVLVVPFYAQGPTYHALTIVRAVSNIRSFEELSGRPFAFADSLSLAGHYYPREWALEGGQDPEVFFRRATFSHGHGKSIDAVVNGVVDGATVNGLVLEAEMKRRPSLRTALRIVHRSRPLSANPVVVPGGLDPALRERLRLAFERAGDSPVGREALRRAGIGRFGPPPEGLYDDEAERLEALLEHEEAGR